MSDKPEEFKAVVPKTDTGEVSFDLNFGGKPNGREEATEIAMNKTFNASFPGIFFNLDELVMVEIHLKPVSVTFREMTQGEINGEGEE